MRLIKRFGEFVEEGIAKKILPDKERAKNLIIEAEKDYNNVFEMIKKLGINDNNSNIFVKSCYDVLMELIRAKMLLDGYNASGFGAHETEVSYMRILGFDESDVQFANELRYFRNGMIYYGTLLDKEYAEKVVNFMNKLYPKLKGMVHLND